MTIRMIQIECEKWALSISLTFWISTHRTARTHLWYHMMDFRASAMQELVCISSGGGGGGCCITLHECDFKIYAYRFWLFFLNFEWHQFQSFRIFWNFRCDEISIENWFLCFIVIMIILICHSLNKKKTKTARKYVMTFTQLNSSTANFRLREQKTNDK